MFRRAYHKELLLLLAAELLLALGLLLSRPWATTTGTTATIRDPFTERVVASSLLKHYQQEKTAVSQLETAQAAAEISVVTSQALQAKLGIIHKDLARLNYIKAHKDEIGLTVSLSGWNRQLKTILAAATSSPELDNASANQTAPAALTVPILMYHHPPPDLDQQFQLLQSENYTTIDLGQLVSALHGSVKLPAKPVVITFDDGYADQMAAFTLLQQYRMKATFFIINGGQASNWCIGAGRKYHLSSQPLSGCGDAYLSWDQIRLLEKSGLITIGAHTVNHSDLPTLPLAQQWFEIYQSKLELETQLGHPVLDFAYPYGAYDQTTLALVQTAGFRSAVTTEPGIDQTPGGEYALKRVRSAYELPQ